MIATSIVGSLQYGPQINSGQFELNYTTQNPSGITYSCLGTQILWIGAYGHETVQHSIHRLMTRLDRASDQSYVTWTSSPYHHGTTTSQHDTLLATVVYELMVSVPHLNPIIRLKPMEPWPNRLWHKLPVLNYQYHMPSRGTKFSFVVLTGTIWWVICSHIPLNWPAAYISGTFIHHMAECNWYKFRHFQWKVVPPIITFTYCYPMTFSISVYIMSHFLFTTVQVSTSMNVIIPISFFLWSVSFWYFAIYNQIFSYFNIGKNAIKYIIINNNFIASSPLNQTCFVHLMWDSSQHKTWNNSLSNCNFL